MPLNFLKTLTPESNIYRSGSGYSDFNQLLKELAEGVQELGVGKCEVRCKDEPMRREFGFELSATRDGQFYWWEFMISLTKFRETGRVFAFQMATTTTRAQLAHWFEEGKSVEEVTSLLAAKFPSPAIQT